MTSGFTREDTPVAASKSSEAATTSEETAVAVAIPQYRDSDLQQISSFDDALALIQEQYGQGGVISASDVLGNGFALLSNKDHLVGVPFLIMKWQFNPGKYAEDFCTALVVTVNNQKYIVNDGGQGLCKQLREYTAQSGRQGGMVVQKGLTRSDYTYTDSDGEERPASTYYIDTSAM